MTHLSLVTDCGICRALHAELAQSGGGTARHQEGDDWHSLNVPLTPLFPQAFGDADDLECVVTDVVSHRNGSCGEGFFVVSFTSEGQSLSAVCFFDVTEEGERLMNYSSPRVAVLSLSDISEQYRGDYFANQLLDAVQAWSDDRAAR